jgi:hypothetical protein
MCAVRSDTIIVIGIGSQDSAQMRLAQDDHMVEVFAPDRSDQSLGISILPRRRWCNGLVPDTHRLQPPRYDCAVDAISIAD